MAQLAQQYDRVFDGVNLLDLLDAEGFESGRGDGILEGEVEDKDRDCAAHDNGDGAAEGACFSRDQRGPVPGQQSPANGQPHEWFIWRTGHYLALRSHGLKIQVGRL